MPLALALVACAPMSREQMDGRADREDKPGNRACERNVRESGYAADDRADTCRRAAQRAGVALDDVKVLTVESVTWPDGSLAVPRARHDVHAGARAGYRIRVDAAGTPMTLPHRCHQHVRPLPAGRAQPPSPMDPT